MQVSVQNNIILTYKSLEMRDLFALVTRLRISAHKLGIESGRYTYVAERFCQARYSNEMFFAQLSTKCS